MNKIRRFPKIYQFPKPYLGALRNSAPYFLIDVNGSKHMQTSPLLHQIANTV